MSFATVPIVDLVFATLGLVLAELAVLSAFASTLRRVELVAGGDVRDKFPGVVARLGFAKLVVVAAISYRDVTEVATFVTLLPPGAFACRCSAFVVVTDAVAVVLVSKPLSADESSHVGNFIIETKALIAKQVTWVPGQYPFHYTDHGPDFIGARSQTRTMQIF